MKLVRTAKCLSVGLMLVAGGVCAQEIAAQQPVTGTTKKAKPAARKPSQSDTRISQQAQAEAAARAKAQEAARLRAEAEARRVAEAEAKEKPLRDADDLMKGGKPAEAYALLEPYEFDRSGEVRFDYLLGISALDSGKPDKATLAFERVLAVDPNFAGARLDMARAYYQLGDMPRAKTEFETVMGQNPPEAAKVTIRKYLDAIQAWEDSKKTHLSGYVEGVVGNDSNVSSGTGTSIAVSSLSPGLSALITAITGDPNPQIPPSRQSDNYYGLNAGGEVSRSFGDNWMLYGGGDLRQRGNMVQMPYDTTSVDGRVGVMYAQDENAYKMTLTSGQTYSANAMRRDSVGANAEWLHTFSPANQMNAFLQYGRNRAVGSPPTALGTDARTSGNTDLAIAGAGWVHIMGDGKQAVFGSAYTGKELDVAPPYIVQPVDGKKQFDGLRVGGQAAVFDELDAYASLGWQHAVYSKPNGFIAGGGSRNEYQYDLVLGASWRFEKLWSIKPQVLFTQKRSNLALYSFDRTDISLTIRRDFK